MIQACILISENKEQDLATFIMLPPWNQTILLDFQQWNPSADEAAKFIRGAQEKAQQAGLPVILDELLWDGLIGLFIGNGYEPVLALRRAGNRNIEAAMQVCDNHGDAVLDIVCARTWSAANCDSEVWIMADKAYQAAVRNEIDFAADPDLVGYLPEPNDVAAPK